MKIGKHHRRFGRPSEKFLEKKRMEEQDRITTPPAEGDVRIYLDDERPCPKGWTLAKTSRDFFRLIEKNPSVAERIKILSLDWYLGAGEPNGFLITEGLADLFKNDPQFLPNLDIICFHSSDHTNAGKMCRTIFDSLSDDRKYDIILQVGSFKG